MLSMTQPNVIAGRKIMAKSASSMRTYLTCPRKYALSRDWEQKHEPTAFTRGTLVHFGIIEGFMKNLSLSAALGGVSIELEKMSESIENVSGFEDKELRKVRAYIKGYYAHNNQEDFFREFEVMATESAFEFSYRNQRFSGRIDALLRRKATGEVILYELKTTSSNVSDPDHPYWSRLNMDTQLAIYNQYVKSSVGRHPRVMYEVIMTSQARPKKNETPKQYEERLTEEYRESPGKYKRMEFELLQSKHEAKMGELVYLGQAIDHDLLLPRNDSACFSNYGTCQFFTVCSWGSNPDESLYLKKKEKKEEEINEFPF